MTKRKLIHHLTSALSLKLPYKLREGWQVITCDLQEQRGHRVSFKDLVQFIECQVKTLSNPLFGDIKEGKVENGGGG